MYWIERCADGSYIHGGIEYPFRQTISKNWKPTRLNAPGRLGESHHPVQPRNRSRMVQMGRTDH